MAGHKIAFTADLHGDKQQYSQLVGYALSHSIDSVIIGGDLCPKNFPPKLRGFYISLQARFLDAELPILLSPLKAGGIETYLIMGNDDAMANLPLLERHDSELYHIIHDKRLRLTDDFEIIGYPYVPITPFRIKDWEKYDLSNPSGSSDFRYIQRMLTNYRLDGLKSTPNGWQDFIFNEEIAQKDSIQKDLLRPEFRKTSEKIVYVIHTPPDLTNLDLVQAGHVGSFAVREFIEGNQPYLTLHGHIHETVTHSGRFQDTIGKTLCMTAGNLEGGGLALIVFDLYEPQKAERIVIPPDNTIQIDQ